MLFNAHTALIISYFEAFPFPVVSFLIVLTETPSYIVSYDVHTTPLRLLINYQRYEASVPMQRFTSSKYTTLIESAVIRIFASHSKSVNNASHHHQSDEVENLTIPLMM